MASMQVSITLEPLSWERPKSLWSLFGSKQLLPRLGVVAGWYFHKSRTSPENPSPAINVSIQLGMAPRRPLLSSAKWWFSLRMIWAFWGPGFRTSWQSCARPKTLFRCLGKWARKRRDASPQNTCRAERNPGPRKPQIRNVQIRNLAVLGSFLALQLCSGTSACNILTLQTSAREREICSSRQLVGCNFCVHNWKIHCLPLSFLPSRYFGEPFCLHFELIRLQLERFCLQLQFLPCNHSENIN